MPSDLTIRRATVADVPGLFALDRASPSAAHWTESQYRDLFIPGAAERLALVAELPTSVLGYLVARHLAPEWELENVVVAPEARRQGLGRRLLEKLLTIARETNSEAVFLEVRESNLAARKLYESAGFAPSGRRRSYYSNPLEDAVVYRFAPPSPISI